jgi:cysteine desulfurase/selenocysteine lyase
MSTQRRTFLKQLGGLTIGSYILPTVSMAEVLSDKDFPKSLSSITDDDEYWKLVREQFPLKKSRTYFNNGTMGPSPYTVIETVQKGFIQVNTDGEYQGEEIAREKLAAFLNVKISEISLTHNTTEGINIMAWGVPLKKDDEVIMTTHEHVGNATPWLNVARLHGIVIKTFTPALTAKENLERIHALITPKTKAIAVPHITCTTGLVLPIKEISKLGKENNLFTCIDGAHGIGSTFLDLKDIGCDFYASNGHKWLLGPLGTGFLYVKEEKLEVLQPYFTGAYSADKWELTEKVQKLEGYIPTAHRYDYGTQNPSLYQGMAAAVDFISTIGAKKIADRGRSLATYLQEHLLNLPDKIEMLSSTEAISRGTMIGFKVKNINLQDFGKKASENNFRIRLVPESGLDSVRISTHIYNNFEELDRFIDFIKKV